MDGHTRLPVDYSQQCYCGALFSFLVLAKSSRGWPMFYWGHLQAFAVRLATHWVVVLGRSGGCGKLAELQKAPLGDFKKELASSFKAKREVSEKQVRHKKSKSQKLLS